MQTIIKKIKDKKITKYISELKELMLIERGNNIKQPKISIKLPELFKDENYFEQIINHVKVKEFYNFDRTSGNYYWKKNKKEYLAALTICLKEKNRLKNEIFKGSNQYLRRVFCDFFHIDISEKTFQPNETKENKKKHFSFINDFN